MRNIIAIVLCFIVISIYAKKPNQTTTGKIHAWTFEDGTANDNIGSNNGTLKNGAVIVSGALKTRNDEYMSLPANKIKINEYSEIAIESWFTPTVNKNYKKEMPMLYFFGNKMKTGGEDALYFSPSGMSNSKAAISYTDKKSNETETSLSYMNLDDNKMHYVVTNINETDITLYIDGELIGTTPLLQDNKISNLSNHDAYIGKGGHTDNTTWEGRIHEINIYNKQLTASEISANYINGPEGEITLENITVNANDTLIIDGAVECHNLTINEGAILIIPISASLIINNDLTILSKASQYAQVYIEGDISIAGIVHIDHTFLGDGSWEFNTVAGEVTDFKLLGDVYNQDYVVYYYDETTRATEGGSNSVWKTPEKLTPGVGYIFAFTAPHTLACEIEASEYLESMLGDITLHYTTSNYFKKRNARRGMESYWQSVSSSNILGCGD